VPKTAVIVFLTMIKVIATKLEKCLIAKSLKLGHRHLISIICMLLLACIESFQQAVIVLEEVFLRIKSRINNQIIEIRCLWPSFNDFAIKNFGSTTLDRKRSYANPSSYPNPNSNPNTNPNSNPNCKL